LYGKVTAKLKTLLCALAVEMLRELIILVSFRFAFAAVFVMFEEIVQLSLHDTQKILFSLGVPGTGGGTAFTVI